MTKASAPDRPLLRGASTDGYNVSGTPAGVDVEQHDSSWQPTPARLPPARKRSLLWVLEQTYNADYFALLGY
jgi:hypothetical protein